MVPDLAARSGNMPGGAVTVSPFVRPYLDEYPLPNGGSLGGGLAEYNFGFNRKVTEHFTQGRVDHNWSDKHQSFARYTFDNADQQLPTDFPQFPRSFRSRNQFFTAEHHFIQSESTIHTSRFSFARTRIGQEVESQYQPAISAIHPGS